MSRHRSGIVRVDTRRLLVRGAAWLGLLLLCGCDVEHARMVQVRYSSERWMQRANVARNDARQNDNFDAEKAKLSWEAAVQLYTRALDTLPPLVGRERPRTPLEVELVRIQNRAVLGIVESLREAGHPEESLEWARALYENSSNWPGTRGRAALEVARCHDAASHWAQALKAYRTWCIGVQKGTWPLHRSELDVPAYVSRRLGDRGQFEARRDWVTLASTAFQEAAKRGEYARDARYSRFLLLLDAQHWDAALRALRQTRQLHDPEGRDSGLVLAEANLLAGALEQPDQAMGLLLGLYRAEANHPVQYRVAALLLAGQIQARRGNLDAALQHYETASQLARSSMGRAEAVLGLARVHAARGEIELASRAYSQLRTSWPATAAGLLASLEEYRMLMHAGMPALRAAGYLSEVLGRTESWDQGVAFLDSMAETFSTDPRAGSLLLRAARIAADRLEDPARAQRLLNRVQQRYPDSDLAVAIQPFADSLRTVLQHP